MANLFGDTMDFSKLDFAELSLELRELVYSQPFQMPAQTTFLGKALKMEICKNCGNCQKNCPAHALERNGTINKHLCGECVFEFGLRHFVRFLEKIVSQKDSENLRAILRSRETREIWQNFMTGNYYYCWRCQETCPVGKMSISN